MLRLPNVRRRSDDEDADSGFDHDDAFHDSDMSADDEGGPALSAALADSVRFPIAEPKGYFFPPVEEFVQQTQEALRFHEERDFQRRRRIHELEQELALQVHDVQRLRTEIELFTVQGTPLVNPDGSYVTESQRDAGDDAGVRAEAEALSAQLQQSQQAHDAVAAELAALRAWADEVEVQFQALHDQVTEKAGLLAAAEQENADLRAQIEALHAGATPSPAPASGDYAADAQFDAEFASADEDEGGYLDDVEQPRPIPLVDSELPPGVALPGDGAPRQYPTAAPGAPLSTVSGPVDQWAPELAAHPGHDA